jgi:hypothetical protein
MNWNGFGRKRSGLIVILSRHLPGRTEDNQVESQASRRPVRTEQLPNTNLERYRYRDVF